MMRSICSRIPAASGNTSSVCRMQLAQSPPTKNLHTRSPLKVVSTIEGTTATRIPTPTSSSKGGMKVMKVLNATSKSTATAGNASIEVGPTTRNITCTTRAERGGDSKTQLSATKARKPSKPSYMSSTYFENEREVFGSDF